MPEDFDWEAFLTGMRTRLDELLPKAVAATRRRLNPQCPICYSNKHEAKDCPERKA